MKLKVAGDKKTETQDDNQRLEELDGTLKERIADTEVSATSFVICAKCRNA
jgi:hypothetical protein